MLPRETLLTRWAVVRDGSLATPGLIQPDLYAASREAGIVCGKSAFFSAGRERRRAHPRGHILATLDHELQITLVNCCDVFSQLDGNSAV